MNKILKTFYPNQYGDIQGIFILIICINKKIQLSNDNKSRTDSTINQ